MYDQHSSSRNTERDISRLSRIKDVVALGAGISEACWGDMESGRRNARIARRRTSRNRDGKEKIRDIGRRKTDEQRKRGNAPSPVTEPSAPSGTSMDTASSNERGMADAAFPAPGKAEEHWGNLKIEQRRRFGNRHRHAEYVGKSLAVAWGGWEIGRYFCSDDEW